METYEESARAVREALYLYEQTIGNRVLAPLNRRYNRSANEHRAIKSLRERGVELVLNPARP